MHVMNLTSLCNNSMAGKFLNFAISKLLQSMITTVRILSSKFNNSLILHILLLLLLHVLYAYLRIDGERNLWYREFQSIYSPWIIKLISNSFLTTGIAHLWVAGPTSGLASNWTKAFEPSINPTSVLFSIKNVWRFWSVSFISAPIKRNKTFQTLNETTPRLGISSVMSRKNCMLYLQNMIESTFHLKKSNLSTAVKTDRISRAYPSVKKIVCICRNIKITAFLLRKFQQNHPIDYMFTLIYGSCLQTQ
jgi:hypothetical protein